LIRPLLDQSKAALREYADRKKIDFREDTSNASLDIRRNRIRHELLPLLRRKYLPALDRTILRVMDIISRDAEFVDEAATRWLKARKPGAFGHLPVAVQRRCIQRQLLRQKIPADYELVERLRLEPGRPMEIEPSRVVMRQPNGRLSIREIRSLAPNPGRVELKLNGAAGSAVFDGVRFQWRIEKWKWSGRPKKVSGSEYFDLDNVGSRIVLRHWQPGDRYQPIGMSSAAKLQDLFTNGKIPQAERHQLVLAVAGGGEVFWVERLRISEHFKLSNETIRRLHWRWKRL
jgi:tRNA(Ile)-lysidine synthase